MIDEFQSYRALFLVSFLPLAFFGSHSSEPDCALHQRWRVTLEPYDDDDHVNDVNVQNCFFVVVNFPSKSSVGGLFLIYLWIQFRGSNLKAKLSFRFAWMRCALVLYQVLLSTIWLVDTHTSGPYITPDECKLLHTMYSITTKIDFKLTSIEASLGQLSVTDRSIHTPCLLLIYHWLSLKW